MSKNVVPDARDRTNRDAQKDRCALCAGPLGEHVWRLRGLPWVFCTEECCDTYAKKDG